MPNEVAGQTSSTEESQEELTVEEVEATWRNRVSQKDKAHAAEAKALRDELAAYKAREARFSEEQRAKTEAEMSEADRWKQRAEALERQVAEERANAIRETRQVKYSAAAEMLDESALMAMDEAKLAALNARLADEGRVPEEGAPSPRFDPNAPRRTMTPPASPSGKTVAELESDLRKYAPEFAARLSGS